MNWRTRLLLVLLQLAIGWHLFYEGIWKIRQKEAWSSKGYLRAASGPCALPVRWLAGDPEVTWAEDHFVTPDPTAEFLARFSVTPFDPNEAPTNRRPHKHLPPALAREWQAYFDGFVKHYHLDDPETMPRDVLAVGTVSPTAVFPANVSWASLLFASQADTEQEKDPRLQHILAKVKFINRQNETVQWLLQGTKNIKLSGLSGPAAALPRKTPDRLAEYLTNLEQIKDLESHDLETFGARVSDKVRRAKQEADALKRSLSDDLDAQTAKMKQALREVLTPEQKRMTLPSAPAAQPPAGWQRLPWIDNAVRWGLTVIGGCLLVGLLTRTACLAGALYLLAFYLPMMPLPGMAESSGAKGHYLFINENIVEILALLVVASSRPGSRYGLDAWLSLLRRGRGDQAMRRPRNLGIRNGAETGV
jgi:uncharacterized membrane protein YphA (DoxX/SURF4 family)